MAIEVYLLLQRTVHEARSAEIEHQAIRLDDAGELLRIDGTQTASDHLDEGGFVRAGTQQDNATGRRVVVALGEHSHVDHDLRTPVLVFS